MFLEDKKSGSSQDVRPIEPWRQVLLDAAQRLRERGWCKGRLRDDAGSNCAIGAIINYTEKSDYVAEFVLMRDNEAIMRLSKYLGCAYQTLSMHIDTVSTWNNNRKRTKEEVIAALEGCALAPERDATCARQP